jgi:hypothetical protein
VHVGLPDVLARDLHAHPANRPRESGERLHGGEIAYHHVAAPTSDEAEKLVALIPSLTQLTASPPYDPMLNMVVS